jgi:N-acetylmuramic acid 6-phosphate etherase
MITEGRNPKSHNIDQLATLDILRVMNEEDAIVPLAIREALPQIAQGVDLIVEQIRAGGRVIYAGAGTSGRLGVLDAAECVPTFSTPPELFRALIAGGAPALTRSLEGVEDQADSGRRDLLAFDPTAQDVVVGVAASGRTPYVIGVLQTANEIKARTIAISCNSPAPILELAQIRIPVLVGPEVISGSTRLKAGTAQKLVLNMLSTASMIKLGKVYDNLMVDVQIANQKLHKRAIGIVAEVADVHESTAANLIVQADGSVKAAILMGILGISAQEAHTRLTEAQGMLRRILNPQL